MREEKREGGKERGGGKRRGREEGREKREDKEGGRVISSLLLSLPLSPLVSRMNAEVLQSRPDILATVSEHLFGQLEGYLSITNMANALVSKWEVMGRDVVEVRESRMGDFLCFINTLSATHKAIRAVLASDMWFGTLLKIVDINPDTGEG